MRESHSLLLGLHEDDHPQYYDITRLAAYLTANPPTPGAHTHLEAEITDHAAYSVPGHTHLEAEVTDLGNYSVVGHAHLEADITDLQAYALATDLNSYLPLTGGTLSGELKVTNALRSDTGNLILADHAGKTYLDIRDLEMFVRVNSDWRFWFTDTSINPYADSAYDLGSTVRLWRDIFVDRVRGSLPYGYDAYNSSTQSVASSTSYSNMTINTERSDPWGNGVSGVFTCPETGLYMFGASTRFQSTVDGDVQKVAVEHSLGAQYESWGSLATEVISTFGMRHCTAGQTLRPKLAQAGTGSKSTYANSSRFWVARVA